MVTAETDDISPPGAWEEELAHAPWLRWRMEHGVTHAGCKWRVEYKEETVEHVTLGDEGESTERS